MPVDASIPLQVRTPEPGPNPLDALARVLQIKNEQARQQLIPGQVALQNQQVQLGQQQLDSTRVLNEAYKQPGMFVTGADGMPTMDTNALGKYLSDNGQGHLVPSITKTGLELNEAAGKVREQRSKLSAEEADYAGLVGAGAMTTAADGTKTADPGKLSLGLAHAATIYGPNSPSAQALQELQQDPSKANDIAGHLIQQSPKQRELATAAQTSAARDLTAKTGAAKEDREAKVQQRGQALQQAAGVTDQASYDQWLQRNPVLKSEAPPTYDPAFVARLAREAVPVKEQPEYDILTRTAQAMAAMKPEDWQAQVDHIAPPRGDTAGLNNRTRVLVNSAVIRGDYKAAQGAIKDASDQLGREDVAKKNAQTKISLDMGAFSGANGEMSPTATAVAHYQIPSAQAMSRMSPQARDALMRQVLQINPAFREQQYATFQGTEKDAVTGKIGTSANALNTMMGHLSVLNQAADALQNHDIQALNKIGNFLGVQTGNDAVTAYKTIVHRIGPEVTKAYVAGGGTGGERGANEEDFSENLSPQQLKSNIGVSAQLADSKIKALQDQYTRGTYGMGTQRLISDEAEQARQRLAGQSPIQGGGQRGGPPPGARVQRNTATGQTRWSTDGGKTWQMQ